MLVLAHRGASAQHPENTLPAFAAAADQGADGVELDVRLTADGGLAVHHDPALADGRDIARLDRSSLPPEVPLVDAALDACAPLAIVNVEVKNLPSEADFDPELRVARVLVHRLAERGDMADERLLISCFHRPTVDLVHELAPELPTALLTIDAPDPERLVDDVATAGHRALHPHHAFVTEALVERCHQAGLALNTWTCDYPDRIVWLESIGVDAVVTNDPRLALHALKR